MEQIKQLRTMRDDALIRLQANPDYRLLTSLDQLIVDLETVVDPSRSGLSVVSANTESQPKVKVDDAAVAALKTMIHRLKLYQFHQQSCQGKPHLLPRTWIH